ncbi:MAG: Arc family DNA binding domain-containing protein [Chromatiales bacterium]
MAKRKAFALRLSEDILGAMQRWADDELRSATAQIEWALREALNRAFCNNRGQPQR